MCRLVSFLLNLLITFASGVILAAEAVGSSPGVTCSDAGLCIAKSERPRTYRFSEGPSPGCSWRGHPVPCSQGRAKFDSQSGCYNALSSDPPIDGPVAAEQKAYGGSILYATCPYGGAGGYIWQPPAKPVVTAAAVRAEAVRLVPSAAVGVAPKNVSLVNVETVLWADAPPRQTLQPVTLLGQRVVITLELEGVSWRFGDGQSASNAPAGKAYDARSDPCKSRQCDQYFGHTFRRTGKVSITAKANWRATFTVDGGIAQNAGNVPGPAASTNLTIKQARGVLVPNPGETP